MKHTIIAALALLAACGTTDNKPKTTEELLAEAARNEMLPGLDPYAVVGALESSGMTATTSHMKSGTNYTFTSGAEGLSLQANMTIWRYGSESEASGLTGMAIAGLNPDIQAARPFIGFLSTVQYTGAAPEEARAWVEANFDTDSAWAIIGEAHFLLRGTEGSRTLLIRRTTTTDGQPR